MGRHFSVALAFLFMAGSCTIPTAPEGAERFAPVQGASLFWDQYEIVRKCVGGLYNHMRFGDIEWYSVPGDSIQNKHGKWVAAFGRGNRIYIASVYLATGFVIGHEIAHQITGIGNSHRDPPFWKCNLMPDQHVVQGQAALILDEEEYEE